MSALVLGGVLLGVLLLIVAALLWQEARTRGQAVDPVFGIEEATEFSLQRLPGDVARRLGSDNVRRVIEWQVDFLQRLAREDDDVPIVVGVTEGTVEHIAAGLAKRHVVLAEEDIAAVLETQGDYLRSIGVVGDEVDESEVFDES